MLGMGTACEQCNAHIGNRRTSQYAQMLPFLQMGQNQSLPVAIQDILTAGGGKFQSAASFQWFQQQMGFRIMPQRLKMSDALYRCGNGFLIHNISGSKGNFQPEPFRDQAF